MKKIKYDIISIGDSTIDVFLKLDQYEILNNETEQHKFLCLNYADKIPVTEINRSVAGNSANLAIGSSRLGLKSAFYTEIGNDPDGNEILQTLKDEKVSTTYVKQEKGRKTNYTAVINTNGERTQLIFHHPRTYKLPKLEPSKWVYLSSMAKGSYKIYEQLEKYLEKTKAKFGFNPGTFQMEEGIRSFKKLLKYTTILILNKEEAKFILKVKKCEDTEGVKCLLQDLKELGPQYVVVTDGPKGAYSFDGARWFHMPIFDAPVIERTGAGDAFSTGLISAMTHERSLEEALVWGSFNSTFVIQKIGPQEGLLYKNEMEALIKKHKDYKPKEIF